MWVKFSRRTIHQGWGPGRRLAQPVCWEPRVRRGPDALVRKAEMCLRGFPSTHWASLGFLHDFMTEFITGGTLRLAYSCQKPVADMVQCSVYAVYGRGPALTFVSPSSLLSTVLSKGCCTLWLATSH